MNYSNQPPQGPPQRPAPYSAPPGSPPPPSQRYALVLGIGGGALVFLTPVIAALVLRKSPSQRHCEAAYAEALALREPGFEARTPRERFVNACKTLSPEAAQCVSMSYGRAHRDECRGHRESIRNALASVIGGSSSGGGAPSGERPVTNMHTDFRVVNPCVERCRDRGPAQSGAYQGCFLACKMRVTAEINMRAQGIRPTGQ